MSVLASGSLVSQRYEVVSRLGKGGMGVVYKAVDRELDETVALKVLRQELAGSPDIARRFRSEIKLARRVTHRNVCRIHGNGRDGPLSYIVMEFVDGEDLRSLARARRLSLDEAFEVTLQIAQALEAIHEMGIVHRDLKSQNVMRDRQGLVKVMDFGIAKSFESDTAGATATGQIIGTPEYMSPEQALGRKLDSRSDIYALGVVSYELFTGGVPFQGDTPVATLMKHVQEPPPFGVGAASQLPRPLAAVVARCLAKRPEDRFASAMEMAQALHIARATPPGAGQETSWAAWASASAARDQDRVLEPTPVPALGPGPDSASLGASGAETTGPGDTHATLVRPRIRPRVRALPVIGLLLAMLTGVLALAVWRAMPGSGSDPAREASKRGALAASGGAVIQDPAPDQADAQPATVPSAPTPAPSTLSEQTEDAPRTRPNAARSTALGAEVSPRALRPPIGAPVLTRMEEEQPDPAEPVSPAAEQRGSAHPAAEPEPAAPPVRVETAPPAIGRLQLGVSPYALVWVDGREVGATPMRPLQLSVGLHTVRLAHPDYQPFLRKVRIQAGETTTLVVDLALDAIPKSHPQPR